jgi:predicted methyltransferase
MRPVIALISGAIVTYPLIDMYISSIPSARIAESVDDPARPADDRQSDAFRKPLETLAFAGVRRGLVIGEFYPGGGYFTRMLSDIVGPTGHIYGIENDHWKGSVKADGKLLVKGKWKNVSIVAKPFGTVSFPHPLDLAWVTQNYHDMKIAEEGKVDTLAFDRAVYGALKPGGTYFILDHQGAPGLSDAEITKLHRINRDLVVKEVTSAGFVLAAEGNFLRNPKDNLQKPIFDASIRGHTDQYALKFVKPAGQRRDKRSILPFPVLIPATD